LELQHSNTNDIFGFHGNTLIAGTKRLLKGEQVLAGQSFSRMGLNSPTDSQPVLDANASTPSIRQPVCADTREITIDGLRQGYTVLLFAGRTQGNTQEQEGPWKATAGSATQGFLLPNDLQGSMSGPAEYLFVYQEDCHGKRSLPGNPPNAPLIRLSVSPPQPALGTLYECARWVHVSNLEPGTTVSLTSDQQDWPVLAGSQVAYSPEIDILLYRPLRAKEIVTATVSPCGSGQGNSSSTAVQALSALNPGGSRSYCAWQNSVKVEKCVPGAGPRVHHRRLARQRRRNHR
jgi:hypothetical protein